MPDTAETTAAEPMTARMREFQSEVDALRVGGGRANPERTWLRLGVAGWVAAIVIEIVAYLGSHGTSDALSQRDFIVVALAGVVVAVISTGLVVTFTLTRYFRYWLIRLIYQDRESSDRLIEALRPR
jgi:hypothetical protein